MPQRLVLPQGAPVGTGGSDLLLRRTLDQLWGAVHALEGTIASLQTTLDQQRQRIDALMTALEAEETGD
jgi:hypothetical protein